jgi:hypothetical protein
MKLVSRRTQRIFRLVARRRRSVAIFLRTSSIATRGQPKLRCVPIACGLGAFCRFLLRAAHSTSQVRNRKLRRIKCKTRVPNRLDGNDQCVVVGDDGGVFVTGSGFSPTPYGGTDAGLQTTFTRYASQALSNHTSDLLSLARISWDGQNRLQALMVGGTRGTVLHLVPSQGDYAFELQVRSHLLARTPLICARSAFAHEVRTSCVSLSSR